MAALAITPPANLETIGAEIFDSLWGQQRGPVPTAGEHAYEVIWKQLIAGQRQPGERLSDAELAAQLDLSRTPVRQALHRLAQDELVRFDPRRGFSVRAFTAADIHEMYDIRRALEVLALHRAAPALGRDDLNRQLHEVRAIRHRLPERPVGLFLQCDFTLHNLFIHASGNGRLIRLLANLRSQVSLFQIRDTSFPHRMESALDDHERILLHLLDGQVTQATAALSQHIDNAKRGVLIDIFGEKGGEVPNCSEATPANGG